MADPKCVRCSERIEHGAPVVFDHGDLIHVRCWRLNESADRVRESKKLTRRSRDLIDQARERVRRDKPAS